MTRPACRAVYRWNEATDCLEEVPRAEWETQAATAAAVERAAQRVLAGLPAGPGPQAPPPETRRR